jgi:hypothetical protein
MLLLEVLRSISIARQERAPTRSAVQFDTEAWHEAAT